MNQLLKTQAFFNIRLLVNGKWMDVTRYAAWDVVYEEQADAIRTLNFTLQKDGQYIVDLMHYGMPVEFTGGTLEKFAKIFVGIVIRMTSSFDETGFVKIRVQCMASTWQRFGKAVYNNYVYPDLKNTRGFKTLSGSISIAQIVEGIAQENDVKVGYVDDVAKSYIFDLDRQVHQYRLSDWALLRKLAKTVNCTVWTEFIDGTEILFFASVNKVKNTANHGTYKEPSFLYPRRGLRGDQQVGNSQNDYGFVQTELAEGQIVLREVSIDEDMATMNSISYASSKYNFETGEEETSFGDIVTDEQGRKFLQMKTLDYAKIDALDKTNPALANQLRQLDMFGNMTWEQIRPFLKNIDTPIDEDAAPYDNAFYGITVDAVCNGDIIIRSQRAYNLYGLSVHSSNLVGHRYWLYSMRHRWTEEGFLTEMTFKK